MQSVPSSLQRWARPLAADRALVHRAARASRPSGFDPSRDHESLAGGTRLRVPPSFHSGVAITAPLRVPF